MAEIPTYNINDLFAHITPLESRFPPTPSQENQFTDGSAPEALPDGAVGGNLESPNFVTGSAGWKISSDGTVEFSSGTFRGTITATTGAIGGFDIGSDYIRDVANSMGMASTVTGGDDVRFWAGDTFANRATAPFRVTEAGAVTASSFTTTGQTTSFIQVPLSKPYTAGEALTGNDAVYISSNPYSISLARASSQYATVNNNLGISTGAITMECWIKIASFPAGSSMNVITKGDSLSHVYYQIYLNITSSTNVEVIFARSAAGVGAYSMGSGSWNPGTTWHHLVYTNSGSEQNGYIDGVLEAGPLATSTGSGTVGVSDELTIGYNLSTGGVSYFDGQIDDVRVWNTALSGTTVASHYTTPCEIGGSESGLVAYHRLNNNYVDSTANGYTLTGVNTPTFSTTTAFSTSKVFKTDADLTGKYENFVGFALATTAVDSSVTVMFSGAVTGFTGLTSGSPYYISNTAGSVSPTIGTNTRKCGIALSPNELLITNIW